LNQISHENVIQLVELFNEKTSKNMNVVTIVTTEVKESLSDYIKLLNKEKLVELVRNISKNYVNQIRKS